MTTTRNAHPVFNFIEVEIEEDSEDGPSVTSTVDGEILQPLIADIAAAADSFVSALLSVGLVAAKWEPFAPDEPTGSRRVATRFTP